MDAFPAAVAWTLEAEGGGKLVHDEGGPTRFGIAQRYNKDIDVRNLTQAGAEEIYRERYWDAVGCDRFHPALAFVLFDCAVNPGTHFALTTLQRIVQVDTDGILGPQTMARVEAFDLRELIAELLQCRAFYWNEKARTYPYKQRYLRGWTLRNYRLSLEVGGWLRSGPPELAVTTEESRA